MEHIEGRLKWIDYAKGIGMLFVITGHCLIPGNCVNIWMYTFHLPLFFIISGILLSNKTIEAPFAKVIKKYATSLLMPYLIIGFPILLLEIFKDYFQHKFSAEAEIKLLFEFAMGGGFQALWFLPCLFIALLINISLLKLIKKPVLVTAVCLALSVICVFLKPEFIILKVLWRSVMASFFISLGYLFKDKLKADTKPSISIAICIVLGALTTLIAFVNGQVSLFSLGLGKYEALYFIGGIIGSVFIFELSKLLSRSNLRPLLYLGENSLFVMTIHVEVISILSFAMDYAFKERSVIFYLLLIALTTIVTLAITPLCKRVYEFIKNALLRNKSA